MPARRRAARPSLSPGELTIVGNVGDDVEVLGLHVSPDLDSILYALAASTTTSAAGGAPARRGRRSSRRRLGRRSWFALGDLDIGLHLVRTQALRAGESLSAVTRAARPGAGLEDALLPATDDPLARASSLRPGTFPFQEWFVARGHRDDVDAVLYRRARSGARPRRACSRRSRKPTLFVIAPSNPYVSIHPILAVARDPRRARGARRVPCVAVSPLIGGRAVKGPADRMLARLAGGTTPAHVAGCYEGLIDALVIDERRRAAAERPAASGRRHATLMTDLAARRAARRAVLERPGAA